MSLKKKENIVPCLLWVSKGVSQSVPDLIQLSLPESKEYNDMREIDPSFEEDENTNDKEEDDDESNEDTQPSENDEDETNSNQVIDSDEEIISKYDLDNYDDSDEDIHCTSIENLQMFPSNKADENLENSDEEDKKEEEENNKIKPDDNLLVVGRYKGVKQINGKHDDTIVIEVYVYNKGEGSFYVHHHMNLEAFPVALEWLDFHPSDEKKGSFVAVGDTTGKIGVWDLDVEGQVCSDYTLERENLKNVYCLGWNKNLRNILASGYSDGIIVLWDLLTCLEKKVLTYHTGSVQALEWDPFEARYLLSGCTEGYVKLYDHQTDRDKPMNSWKIKGEIEKVCWNKVLTSKFFCATDKGFVYCFDVGSGLQRKIKAHTDCVTALDVSPDYHNLLMTASYDRSIKVWDLDHLTEESNQSLEPIYQRETTVDQIFTAKFAPDSELIIAVGGNSKDNNLKILDLGDLNPDKRRNGENTSTQNNLSEHYSDQSLVLKTCNEKKRKKKVKNPTAEEEKEESAPAKKKDKKNFTKTSTQKGNSLGTNSRTNFLHQKTHKDESFKQYSKNQNTLIKKKRKHKAK